jgi:hypothetical protein
MGYIGKEEWARELLEDLAPGSTEIIDMALRDLCSRQPREVLLVMYEVASRYNLQAQVKLYSAAINLLDEAAA